MGKLIGSFLVEKGLITESQIPLILKYAEDHHLRFGEAAAELKLFPIEKLIALFGPNYKHDFFNLDSTYFPVATKDALSVDHVLRDGALLLGFKTEYKFFKKKKILNVGLLDPSNAQSLARVIQTVQGRLGADSFDKTKVFLILADQYLDVLQKVYGMDDQKIRAVGASALNETLAMYLESFSKPVSTH